MAKRMARVENGVVVNVLWCSNSQSNTDTLIAIGDRPVAIGDDYIGSTFYRNGDRILTPFEKAQAEIAQLKEENAMLKECLLEMSEIVYA